MRTLATLLVVVPLVTTAGCSAFDSTSDEERDPVTVDDERVPGLTEDGIDDTVALSNAHYDELEATPFERTQVMHIHDESGTVVGVETVTQTVTDDTAHRVRESDPEYIDNEPSTIVTSQLWRTDDEALSRVTDATGESYVDPQASGVENSAIPISMHRFDEVDHSVTVEETDSGAERYRLEGAGNVSDDEFVEFDVRFRPTGTIETYEIEHTLPADGERQTRMYTGEFTLADDIELAEPAWVEDARTELEAMADA